MDQFNSTHDKDDESEDRESTNLPVKLLDKLGADVYDKNQVVDDDSYDRKASLHQHQQNFDTIQRDTPGRMQQVKPKGVSIMDKNGIHD